MSGTDAQRRAMIEALRRPLADLPDPLPIPVIHQPFDVKVCPPGSKSLTNRALLLAGLASGESTLHGPLMEADDAARMMAALVALGVAFRRQVDSLTVRGVAGRWRVPAGGVTLDLGNAGTATRFLTAAAMLAEPAERVGQSGPITIDGNERMRQRPIGDLVAALQQIGVRVEYAGRKGFPPMRITAPADLGSLSTDVQFGQTASSQFISGLMLAAPWLPGGMTFRFGAAVTSASYVEMTLGLLRRCGAHAKGALPGPITVFPAEPTRASEQAGGPAIGLQGFEYDVEPDASGATYFWGAAAITPGSRVTTPGLGRGSLQGDVGFVKLLGTMGARVSMTENQTSVAAGQEIKPASVNFVDMPDAAMTMAAVCCLAGGPSNLGGLRTLRVKETDRIAALTAELAKIGVTVRSQGSPHAAGEVAMSEEAIRIEPPTGGIDCSPTARPVEFETYDDHRMAMSLALIGLRRPHVGIRDPGCVRKTYPGFWRDLAGLYG